jgi:SAM-dependent methyltransferase
MQSYRPDDYRKRLADDDPYAGLLSGDPARAGTKTLLEPGYADLYTANLLSHLRRLGLPKGGAVDLGCGAGAVAAALHGQLRHPVWGIDLSPAAIAYAARTFPGPTFACRSADDLSDVPDGALALAHAREFSPFSRTADARLHQSFLEAARPKLMDGGLFVVVQVREFQMDASLADVFSEVSESARRLGFTEAGTMMMVPQFFYRRFGALGQVWPLSALIQLAGRQLERARPGRVSRLFWFRAGDAA